MKPVMLLCGLLPIAIESEKGRDRERSKEERAQEKGGTNMKEK